MMPAIAKGAEMEVQQVIQDVCDDNNDANKQTQSKLCCLPINIIFHILDYLDVTSLKNLRIVSRTTRSWVENETPRYIGKVVIHIPDPDSLNVAGINYLLASGTKWTNFKVDVNPFADPSFKNMVFFLNQYRNTMETVTFFISGFYKAVEEGNQFLTEILFHLGPQLKSLHIVGILMHSYSNSYLHERLNEISRMPPDDQFIQLRHLNFQIGRISETSIKYVTCLVRYFLKNCPNLTSFKIPIGFRHLNCWMTPDSYEADSRSLLDFMKRKTLTTENRTGIDIDFCSMKDCLDSSLEPIYPFTLTELHVMKKLVKFCNQVGGRLFNVPSSALPYPHNLSEEEMINFNKSIVSVLCLNTMSSSVGNVYIPLEASVELKVKLDKRVTTSYNVQLIDDLNLISIHVYVDHGYKWSKLFFDQLLRWHIPSVSKLEINTFTRKGINFGMDRLSSAYPNLQNLIMRSPPANPSTILLDISLLAGCDWENLQDLTLDTVIFDFDSQIGREEEQPFIKTIKRLSHLQLLNVQHPTCVITDYTFRHLFSQMKLKTFILNLKIHTNGECTRIPVTYERGILALISCESSFSNSIETFECFVPADTVYEEMTLFIANFKNLKNYKIVTPEWALTSPPKPNPQVRPPIQPLEELQSRRQGRRERRKRKEQFVATEPRVSEQDNLIDLYPEPEIPLNIMEMDVFVNFVGVMFNSKPGTHFYSKHRGLQEVPWIPSENMAQLQHLDPQVERVDHHSIEYITYLLRYFLQNCPNLESVKIPIGNMCSPNPIYQNVAEVECKPLLDFLTRKNTPGYEGNIDIDFCSTKNSIIGIKDSPIYPFPLTPDILVKLAKLCHPIRGRLFNVPATALPTQKDAAKLTIDEIRCLYLSVKSVIFIDCVTSDLKNAFIPPKATVEIVVRLEHLDRKRNTPTLELPSALNLTSFKLFINFGRNSARDFFKKLFVGSYYSLHELEVRTASSDKNHSWVRCLNSVFPNLQKLWLGCSSPANTAEHLWFNVFIPGDFTNLQDLTLYRSVINFDTLLKKNHLFIETVKRLVHLQLLELPDVNYVSNYTFQQLFSQMKLKTFVLRIWTRNGRSAVPAVTFQDGICSLASAEANFKETIETFECFLPNDATYKVMSKFLENFTRIKSYKIFDFSRIVDPDPAQEVPELDRIHPSKLWSLKSKH